MGHYSKHVFICTNLKDNGRKCCANADAKQAFAYLKEKMIERGVHGAGQIRVSQSGCLGRCALGPCIVVYPEGLWYTYHALTDIDEIVEQILSANPIISRLNIAKDQ